MATPSTPLLARTYEALRPKILGRLIEVRASLDPSFARMSEETAREQLTAVVDHVRNFVLTGDLGLHRAFLHTFIAIRAAEAQSPATVLSMLVAIGDCAAQVVQEETGSTPEGAALTLLLTRVTASTARAINELMAEEVGRRIAAKRELAGRGGAS
jgi:hypothetical protein